MKNTIKYLKKMGFIILKTAKKTANGPDIEAVRNDGATFRIEVKSVRKMKKSYAVHPVEALRRHDDLIAIEFPSGYVLIEPMKDHLKNCSKAGGRCFYGIG
jgi:hypothetical protein